jgi:protein gp37
MQNSKIEWTDKTWNPVTGCTKVSQGCKNCYAEKIYERFNGKGSFKNIICHEDRLMQPLRWKQPAMIFVNSMSDIFHESLSIQTIAEIYAIFFLAHWHTFQVLTKRADRMRDVLTSDEFKEELCNAVNRMHHLFIKPLEQTLYFDAEILQELPLKNVWQIVSVEDQPNADERIPYLLQTPAFIRGLSCEPLIGAIDLTKLLMIRSDNDLKPDVTINSLKGWHGGFNRPEVTKIDWVICGGESGSKARPMHPDWARSLRDQCNTAGVPFFFKQWGEYGTVYQPLFKMYHSYLHFTQKDWVNKGDACLSIDGTTCKRGKDFQECAYPVAIMQRIGKKEAGRLLDGKEWNEMPKMNVCNC